MKISAFRNVDENKEDGFFLIIPTLLRVGALVDVTCRFALIKGHMLLAIMLKNEQNGRNYSDIKGGGFMMGEEGGGGGV